MDTPHKKDWKQVLKELQEALAKQEAEQKPYKRPQEEKKPLTNIN